MWSLKSVIWGLFFSGGCQGPLGGGGLVALSGQKEGWWACLHRVSTPGWQTASSSCRRFPLLQERSCYAASPRASDLMPSTQNLVGHAGLYKLQGLTLEAGANIHSSEKQNQGVLGNTGVFYTQFGIPVILRVPKPTSATIPRKACN